MTSPGQASSGTLWHHSKVKPLEVLVVGGGIAGVEALMALADLGESRLRLRIVAANPSFVLRPQILGEPWGGDPLHIDLARLCRAFGADFTAGTVDAVDADEHRVGLTDGTTLPYDRLLLAPGARPALPYAAAHVLGFGPLPHELTSESAGSVAIVVPPGTSWTLPAYELALLTAARGRRDVRVVTAETAPLTLFGPAAQSAIRALLHRCGVVVEAGRAPEIGADVSDLADTVIALPLLEGPAIAGVPQDRHGFVQVDAAMAVLATEHVHAAGDATDGPVKQGGLAGQQADTAVAGIVRSCGGEPPMVAYEPVLRGKLTSADDEELFLRRALDGADAGEASAERLWEPPGVVCAWRLARWLSYRRDELDEYTLDHVARPRHPVAS
ncbi:FAD-dependent oxidoreductase [Baekduia sp.]|jgi:sulfide:quinone oxidoreductase|uniref:FAD-dependent oxidoreductase n=1 Tax=Baekduia sp. TaxID=2600305 RepID=UPI002E03CFEE|nr:FAD-dependent oxidoreductase [Baekduia sp.]